MYELIGLGVLFVALLVYLALRHRRRDADSYAAKPAPDRPEQLRRLRGDPRFWGVAIESHCRASSRYAGAKFAFDDLPG